MGCDIHMYVEYKNKSYKDEQSFSSFGGRINPGRNYFMFGLLSQGVRSDNSEGIEAKGMPDIETLGWQSRSDSIIHINDQYAEEENYTSLEQAKKWEKYGHKILYRNDEPYAIEHPDWHSHSWINAEELQLVLEKYNNHPEASKYPEPSYNAILAILKSFEKDGMDARVVFWFDN